MSGIEGRPKFELMALSAKDAFLQVMDEKKWSTEIMFAMQILRGNDLLQKCDGQSIKNAVVNLALTGATLNPVVGQAYLVPRGGKCCLDFSYRGLAGIAMDSGSVKHIAPRLVYDFDIFDYKEIDGEPHVIHTPSFNPPEDFTKGPEQFWAHLVCGYVVATLHDGTKIITQPLPKWKLEKAMKTSKTSSGQTPWRTHADEMCLKTLVKHAYKLLPQTERMGQAVSILNEHEGLEDKPDLASNIMDRFKSPVDTVTGETSITDAEIVESSHEQEEQDPSAPKISEKQVKLLHVKIKAAGITPDDFKAHYKLEHLADLQASKINDVLADLESGKVPKAEAIEQPLPEICNYCGLTNGHDEECPEAH